MTDLNTAQLVEELRRTREELDAHLRERTADLVASEQQFRQLAENIEEVFWISTPDRKRVLYVSPAYERVFYRSCQSLYDNMTSFLEVVHPDDRKILLDVIARKGDGPGEVEYRVLSPDNDCHWILTQWFPVYADSGEVARVAGISRDITKHKLAEERLQREDKLLRKLLQFQDRDRKLVAHEIHDGMVQYVTGAKMILEGLRHHLETRGRLNPDDLTAVESLLAKAIGEGRRLISDLRPMVIDDEGLIAAINYLVAEETGKAKLAISFTHAVTFERLPKLMENTIFRIVQEALTNIRRHSEARRVDIRLIQDEGRIKVDVLDDGKGFDPEHLPEDRFGVRGIKERARMVGGTARIKSETGVGTLVSVRLPLDLSKDTELFEDPRS